jgi:hypothetical protein
MSVLFHHYKELIRLISEVEQMNEATATIANNSSKKKKKEVTIEEESSLQSKLIDL